MAKRRLENQHDGQMPAEKRTKPVHQRVIINLAILRFADWKKKEAGIENIEFQSWLTELTQFLAGEGMTYDKAKVRQYVADLTKEANSRDKSSYRMVREGSSAIRISYLNYLHRSIEPRSDTSFATAETSQYHTDDAQCSPGETACAVDARGIDLSDNIEHEASPKTQPESPVSVASNPEPAVPNVVAASSAPRNLYEGPQVARTYRRVDATFQTSARHNSRTATARQLEVSGVKKRGSQPQSQTCQAQKTDCTFAERMTPHDYGHAESQSHSTDKYLRNWSNRPALLARPEINSLGMESSKVAKEMTDILGSMESAVRTLFQLAGIDGPLVATFAQCPAPPLLNLYQILFGLDDWSPRAGYLQRRKMPQVSDTLLGLIGAAVKKEVFDKVRPWQGPTSVNIAKAHRPYLEQVVFRHAGVDLDTVLHISAHEEVHGRERMGEDAVLEPRTLADGLTLALSPHLEALKASMPVPQRLEHALGESWRSNLVEVFDKSLLLKAKMSVSKDTYSFPWYGFGDALARDRMKDRYAYHTHDIVYLTLFPGVQLHKENFPQPIAVSDTHILGGES